MRFSLNTKEFVLFLNNFRGKNLSKIVMLFRLDFLYYSSLNGMIKKFSQQKITQKTSKTVILYILFIINSRVIQFFFEVWTMLFVLDQQNTRVFFSSFLFQVFFVQVYSVNAEKTIMGSFLYLIWCDVMTCWAFRVINDTIWRDHERREMLSIHEKQKNLSLPSFRAFFSIANFSLFQL